VFSGQPADSPSPTYASWKFRTVLESRIEQAQAHVAKFNSNLAPAGPVIAAMR
jgi:hypothetical protein